MATAFDEARRVLLPRWRESRRSPSLENATADAGRVFYDQDRFETLRREWLEEHTVAHASELVGAAIVNDRVSEVRDAAEQLLRESATSTNVRRLAERALSLKAAPVLAQESGEPDHARARIAKLRRIIREDPRNAIALVDLSREFAILGLSAKAVGAMRVATELASETRFVLRAACALYVHLGEPDRALHLLRRASRTRSDAWLMAAEIAASEAARVTPATTKPGFRLLTTGDSSPFQTTELAGALATQELFAGSVKSAKKLFTTALVDPNENTVAQAEWATGQIRGLPLEPRHFLVPCSFEARAREHRQQGKWKDALAEARRWLLDQPFSAGAASFASYIAATALDDQREAQRLAEVGLRANPHDQVLQNNLVVALALNGKPIEAAKVFSSISPAADLPRRATLLATAGLLRYRQGDFVKGREHYSRAIEMLRGKAVARLRANAALFRAREELRAKGEFAYEYARYAYDEAMASNVPEVTAFLHIVAKLAEGKGIVLPSPPP